MFSIEVSNLHWLPGMKETEDLCLHGDAVVTIGDEQLSFPATVSASALYLLKSVTEDHVIHKGNQLLPCCGFFMAPDKTLSSVEIIGCDNGIDWTVLHEEDDVVLVTESGKKTVISFETYRDTVFAFADRIEDFYKSSTEKELPADPLERDGYTAFWNEWRARRYG